MKNNYLIGLGAIALGMFAYSRYAKKDNSGQAEDPNTGGGGGGGGGGTFFPNIPTPPAPPIPPIPPIIPKPPVIPKPIFTTRGTVVVAAPTTAMNNPVQSGIIPSGVSGTGTNTGGITGAGTGTTTGSGSGGTSVTVKYNPNDYYVKAGLPFDGSGNKCKTPIYLNDLVRSWNRP